MKKSSCVKSFTPAGTLSFELDTKEAGYEPILGAAYLLTDRAFAALEGDRAGKMRVILRPKGDRGPQALKALSEDFLRELETQRVRWRIARNNLPIREFVAEQAVLLANGRLPAPAAHAPGTPAAEDLTQEQRQEIEKLIAEVEEEIKAINEKKAVPDPKGIKASWEERHSPGKGAS